MGGGGGGELLVPAVKVGSEARPQESMPLFLEAMGIDVRANLPS